MRFPEMAREALLKHVPEARTETAEWGRKPGIIWVRWQRPDSKYASIALRRHMDWATGEVGISPEPLAHDDLPLELGVSFDKPAFRVRLGVLMHEEDRWWPVGTTTREIRERLEGLVLQLRAKVETLGTWAGARR
ncbi:MAG: hypothetical protein ABIS67_11870 [Candidatus Eisenbacteria bacterium]